MPLIFHKDIQHNTSIGVWHIEEAPQFFIQALQLDEKEEAYLETMKSHRRKEWLTSRYLADKLCGGNCRIKIIKDTLGKPSLEDKTHHISISHSRDRVAVIRSDVPVGIDIQHEEQKIVRIHQKFIHTDEIARIDASALIPSYHIFWGAKESMYKAYGKRELDFRQHMHLYPFKYYQSNLELSGWVRKEDIAQDYQIFTDKLDKYYLSYCLLNYD
ncbi:MAG: 4'-phosphopantetheinyl transferase superfamily protein [Saprospiraceae bacterium]|nr:4'-phosphopantetheinyl transferase superfamily protein [Saprospiraceae bacterium]